MATGKDSATTSIYNEDMPSSSTVLYSGTYVATQPAGYKSTTITSLYTGSTNNKFSPFAPDTVKVSTTTVRSQIGCVPAISNALVKSSSTEWGSSHVLFAGTTNVPVSYGYVSSVSTKSINYIVVWPSKSSSVVSQVDFSMNDYYIYPKFCGASPSSKLNTDNGATNIDLPFSSCLVMATPTFGSNSNKNFVSGTSNNLTTQTTSFYNKSGIEQTISFNMHLCATNKAASNSALYNPYGVRVTVRDLSDNLVNNSIKNNIYTISGVVSNVNFTSLGLVQISQTSSAINISELVVPANCWLDITLMKIVSSPTVSVLNGIATNDSAYLFIDLKDLLFIKPKLNITTELSSYIYGGTNDIKAIARLESTNITGDKINGQQLQISIRNQNGRNYDVSGNQYGYSPVTVDASGNATIFFSSRMVSQGTYNMIVYYDASPNSSLINDSDPITNVYPYPDAASHYLTMNPDSNSIYSQDFQITRQDLRVVYTSADTSNNNLTTPISILKTQSFSNFTIYDANNNTSTPITSFFGKYRFTISDMSGNSVYTLDSSGNGVSNFSTISLPTRRLQPNKQYKFNLLFTPKNSNGTDNDNINPSTSVDYTFTTEAPKLNQILQLNSTTVTNPILPYTQSMNIICTLNDSSGNLYAISDFSNNNCIARITDASGATINNSISLVPYAGNNNYVVSISPKTLNLLRSKSTTFNISSVFTTSTFSSSITSTNSSLFQFLGVNLSFTISNTNPTFYDTIKLLSKIQDISNNAIYSNSDIPGSITYSIVKGLGLNTNVPNQDASNNYSYSLTPNSLNLDANSNPINVVAKFNYTDASINFLTNTQQFSVVRITPTMTVRPTSVTKNYNDTQTFTVDLSSNYSYNDLGTLYLYGDASSPIQTITNARLNTSNTFTNVRISDLKPNTISTLQTNQDISGNVLWVPNNSNVYNNTSPSNFIETLSQTMTKFSNIAINNNGSYFSNPITITGQIDSSYNEQIGGTIYLYNTDASNVLVTSSPVTYDSVNLQNKFTLNVTSDIVTTYHFKIAFIPTYTNIYSDANYNTSTYLVFRGIDITPVITINDLTGSTSSNASTVSLPYTHNFNIAVSGLSSINGSTATIQIGSYYSSGPLTIQNGSVISNNINFLGYIESLDLLNIPLSQTLTLSIDGFDSTKYSIVTPTPGSDQFATIQFTKDTSLPSITSIEIDPSGSTTATNTLIYGNQYLVKGTFNLVYDSSNAIIPIPGSLKLYTGSATHTINSNLTISNTTQTIVSSFIPSDYGLTVGSYPFTFRFVPNDTNITSPSFGPATYTIEPSTITDVSLNLLPADDAEVTYYNEKFQGTLSFFNNGIDGSMNVYCQDPSGIQQNQLLSSTKINFADKNTFVSYDILCNAIKFDCYPTSTSYSIVVQFVSSDTSKYANGTMSTIYSYSVSTADVQLNSLTINGSNWEDYQYNGGVYKYLGETITISGNINTISNKTVLNGKVAIIAYVNQEIDQNGYPLYYENSNPIYLNNLINNVPLQGGLTDFSGTSYTQVDSSGNFNCSILLSSTSQLVTLFNDTGSSYFQIIYYNSIDYNTNYFSNSNISSIYTYNLLVNNLQPSDVSFNLDKFNNSYNFPYHETLLHFTILINKPYSLMTNASVVVMLSNGGLQIGNGNAGSPGQYIITLSSYNNGNMSYGELYLSPKTQNITVQSNISSLILIAGLTGYNSYNSYLPNSTKFNIVKTMPVISLGLMPASIDYEGSANILIQVKPQYAIDPSANVNQNISGIVTLYNQNGSGVQMQLLYNGTTNNSITFSTEISGSGSWDSNTIVNYSPKDNSNTIITSISNIYATFTPANSRDYSSATLSKPFTITKYTPTLGVNSIAPVNDIPHNMTLSYVDASFVFYSDVSSVVYNNVLNFDESFNIITTLTKNIPGNTTYWYSSNMTDASFVQLTPMQSNFNSSTNQLVATFRPQLIQIPETNYYYLKTTFTPSNSNVYQSTSSQIAPFNIYQSNTYGGGFLYWTDINNANTNKTISYNSTESLTIVALFVFANKVAVSEKRARVDLYYDMDNGLSNKIGSSKYLDLTALDPSYNSTSCTFTISGTTLNYRSNNYPIRATFTPVDSNNNRNKNYPIMVSETSPLALTVKPYITVSDASFNYEYSTDISFSIYLAGGLAELSPYSILYISTTNFDSSTISYSNTSTYDFSTAPIVNGKKTVTFSKFQAYLNKNNISLPPGKYSLSIYAKDASNTVQTETATSVFTIPKKSVPLSLTFDKYCLTYRSNITALLNIGGFSLASTIDGAVLPNNQIDISFTNCETNQITTKVIPGSSLSSPDASYNYTYSIPEISSWLQSGLYKVSALLNNTYYAGSQSDNTNGRLLVAKETNCSIVLNQPAYTSYYGLDVSINALVKYNSTGETITTGQLTLIVNNGPATPVNSNFTVSSSILNKDINNLLLYYNDSSNNYIAPSLPFQINVGKKTSGFSVPVLSHTGVDTENNFTLNLTNASSGVVTFYKDAGIIPLVPDSSSNSTYNFSFTNLAYGSNNIYALVNTTTYDASSNLITVTRNQYDVSVNLISALNTMYKSNTLVSLRYQVNKKTDASQNITSGVIEFHRVLYNTSKTTVIHDEIIGYNNVVNNQATLSNYKLIGNANTDASGNYYDDNIQFYGKYLNSIVYSNSQSLNSQFVTVYSKYRTQVTDNTILAASYKLGQTVTLRYTVTDASSSVAVTQGYLAIYKLFNSTSQLLGNLHLDSSGSATLSHKLIDVGSVSFYSKFVDSADYYGFTSSSKQTSVVQEYPVTVLNNTSLPNIYKLGDQVQLNFNVTSNSNPVTEGVLAICKNIGSYKQVLQYYNLDISNNGTISHSETLIDVGSISYYANYLYSTNYADASSNNTQITVVKYLDASVNDVTVYGNSYKLGDKIDLSYNFTSTSTQIKEGVVEIHKVVSTVDEIIGFVTLNTFNNGSISFPYYLIDASNIQFYAAYKGTAKYAPIDNKSSARTVTVVDKYVVAVQNNSSIAPNARYKLGSSIALQYNVSYNSLPVQEGAIEITKSAGSSTEILSYVNLDTSGNASFNYTLTDIDCSATFIGSYINSTNYKQITSTPSNTIYVFSKHNSSLARTSAINPLATSYKLGDSITLEYQARNNEDQVIANDGNIYIHKLGTGSDEIIYYAAPDSNGKVSYTYNIDTSGNTSYYGKFADSINYYPSSSSIDAISIVKEYSGAVNTLTSSTTTPSYGNQITLTSNITSNSSIINEGNIAFYVSVAGGPNECIGTNDVSGNSASISYTVNDIGPIIFSSVFQNSINYYDSASSPITVTVGKNNIKSLTLTPPSVNPVEFGVVNIVANIDYSFNLCYANTGKVQFTISNNDSSYNAIVDIINKKSTYKLYVANTLNYSISAQFMGSVEFNSFTASSISFDPSVNSNYSALNYVVTDVSGVSNYSRVSATMTFTDSSINDLFLLKNTGFVIFDSSSNDVLQPEFKIIVPLVNGTASSYVRKDLGYSYNVKFVDKVINPSITLTGRTPT